MPKLTFQWNLLPKLILGAKVHRLVPKLFRAEVTRAEHRLPRGKPDNEFCDNEFRETVYSYRGYLQLNLLKDYLVYYRKERTNGKNS